MRTQQRVSLCILFVILSLLFTQSITVNKPAAANTLAEHQTYLPLLLRKVFLPSSGELDPSFGQGGIVSINFNDSWEYGQAIMIDKDGKILASGFTFADDYCYLLARFNMDGSLDTSFAGDGWVMIPFSINELVQQEDGKIVTVGSKTNDDWTRDIIVARFNPLDGSLDTSFGSEGLVTIDLESHSYGYDLLLQPDGKIVVVGWTDMDGIYQLVVVRMNQDGSLDTSFGAEGMIITNLGYYNASANAVALQDDNKILIGGYVVPDDMADIAVIRLNPDGSLDTSFDGDGWVSTDFFGYDDLGADILLHPDGKIIAAGLSYGAMYSDPDMALVRYNPDGSLDSSFGGGIAGEGKVVTDFGYGLTDSATAVALQPDGKIVLAGVTYTIDFYTEHLSLFAVSRYNPDGSLDMTFAGDGLVTTDAGDSQQDISCNDMELQPNGKILLIGEISSGFVMIRFK